MKVFRIFRLVDGDLVADDQLPAKCGFSIGDVVGPLTNLHRTDGAANDWTLELLLSAGDKRQHITLPLEPFVFPEELLTAETSPICLEDLRAVRDAIASSSLSMKPGRWLWLFRNGLYVVERPVRDSEIDEVILAIKARHYRSDERLKRLQAEVANFEALDQARQTKQNRRLLRDDVKLLVWTRDGGRCVACQSDRELHFDHVIPFSRGGSDEADNIQLLCRTCNLSKSNRIV